MDIRPWFHEPADQFVGRDITRFSPRIICRGSIRSVEQLGDFFNIIVVDFYELAAKKGTWEQSLTHSITLRPRWMDVKNPVELPGGEYVIPDELGVSIIHAPGRSLSTDLNRFQGWDSFQGEQFASRDLMKISFGRLPGYRVRAVIQRTEVLSKRQRGGRLRMTFGRTAQLEYAADCWTQVHAGSSFSRDIALLGEPTMTPECHFMWSDNDVYYVVCHKDSGLDFDQIVSAPLSA